MAADPNRIILSWDGKALANLVSEMSKVFILPMIIQPMIIQPMTDDVQLTSPSANQFNIVAQCVSALVAAVKTQVC